MRAVVQRVLSARVTVEGETTGAIGNGILLLLGVGNGDTQKDADYLVNKVINLRIFDDAEGKMNRSLADTNGGLLVVSQFTLQGDSRKGLRPSYINAAQPEDAVKLYEYFVEKCASLIEKVETGKFQAMMEVELINDGPVTILLDSKKQF